MARPFTDPDAKPHTSSSQIGMYSRCGEQYRRCYIEGERIPPGISLLVGSGVHTGAETNFTQKIESHEDLPGDDIVDAAVAGFKARVAGDGYQLSDDEAGQGAKKVLGAAVDQTAALAACHAEEQAPDYQPVAVEHKALIVLPKASRDILGYMDLVDDKKRVIDLKTAAKKLPKGDADKSFQLTVYAAAYHVEHGEPPAEVRLDVVTKTKTPARQVLSSTRDRKDYETLIKRVNATIHAIDAGVFVPASPGDWCCSPRWCGYWATCPYVNSERIDAAQKARQ